MSVVLPNNARLISTRRVSFLDSDSLEQGQAHEALFRDGSRYILYKSNEATQDPRE